MKDIDDWAYILDHTDALFYRLAVGIASRADISLVDSHEGLWTAFEQGHFKLLGGDADNVEVVPCQGDNERRSAIDQNKPLASYRQRVIEQEVEAGRIDCHTACSYRGSKLSSR